MPANALWLQQILSMFENSNLFLPFQNDANCAIGAKKNARNFHYIYLSLFSVKPFFSLCFCASIDGLQYILLPSIQSFRDCFRLPQLLGFFPRSLDSTYTKSVSNLSNFRQRVPLLQLVVSQYRPFFRIVSSYIMLFKIFITGWQNCLKELSNCP